MYAELHAASAFSFLEGASLPEDLIAEAARLGYRSMALCDRDGVYGAPRFYQTAKAVGVRPLVGCEISLETGRRLTVLVESRIGYRNLCRLLTRMHLGAPKGEGRADWRNIEFHASGLIALLADLRDAESVRSIFGPDRLYVELQRHFHDGQEAANKARIDFARHHRLPLLATNGVRHSKRAGRDLFDVLTCIRHKTTLDGAGRLLSANRERHVKSPAEMRRLFADVPDAVRNSLELSERLQFTLENLGYRFPDFPLPQGETADSYLRKMTELGARDRYRPYDDKSRRQIDHELNVIAKLKLAGYFLIVWDIVRFCRRNNILVQGRGSAANSAVCYALGLTAVDPVKMELLFERFLSEERGEWPDIDLDLPSGDQRERAIQYVYDRYGKHGAAMTANVITYRERSAVREVGKALGFPEEAIGRLSKCIHHMDAFEDGERVKHYLEMAGFDPSHARLQHLARLCGEVLNLPRHLSQHPGGLVICQEELDGIVPLEKARMPDRRILQWDKEDCADLKMIKVDLLGLGMMKALEECVEVLNGRGVDFGLAHIPPDDPKTYKMIQKADTVGVFQIESRAQMVTLPRMKPARFYDLVVEVAIIRPGPIVGKLTHPYLNRRMGREPVTYPHPSLEPILKRTLGVPLFQEQLLRVAMTAAGFTGGEAEELRRAMGFKRSTERMQGIEKKLRQGLHKNGIHGAGEEEIIRAISSFALFGFPESHSASFALLAYASSYLKAHHPAVFCAALLNAQPMGFYRPSTLVKDAQRHGVRVRPVDVLVSDVRCTVDNEMCLRIGLNYVSGLRSAAAGRIVAERARKRFASVDDLARRARLPKRDLDTLAELGALNSLDEKMHRREALWQVEKAWRPRGPLLDELEDDPEPSPLDPMRPLERLDADYRGAGLTTGPHPLHYLRPALRERGALSATELTAYNHGQWVQVAGAVIARQRPSTAKGFVFLSLEDETGISNIVVRPPMFQKFRLLWTSEPFILVAGVVQKQDGVIHVKAQQIEPLQAGEGPGSHDFH